jgi:hypothetical protein
MDYNYEWLLNYHQSISKKIIYFIIIAQEWSEINEGKYVYKSRGNELIRLGCISIYKQQYANELQTEYLLFSKITSYETPLRHNSLLSATCIVYLRVPSIHMPSSNSNL